MRRWHNGTAPACRVGFREFDSHPALDSMFIVKKKVNGGEYYYLRESKRVEDKETGKIKVKAISVAYLGKDKEEAERKAAEIMTNSGKNEKLEVKESAGEGEMEEELEQGIKQHEPKSEKSKIGIEEMMIFCKRKGFVYPSAEIYGGLAGFWDYGHLGVELKNNVKKEWWQFHVRERNDMAGIDGSIITNPKVWEASGHVASFKDVSINCKKCKKPNKIDKNEIGKAKCINCGGELDKESAKELQMMFTTQVGPLKETSTISYLRPETAQLIFADFKFVQNDSRKQLPFGIAQIGKAFRNEIAPRDFLFRCREFEQMEIEYFVDPAEKCPYPIGESSILVYSAEMQASGKPPVKMKFRDAFAKGIIKTDWHAYWLEQEFLWFTQLGANPDKFRIRQHLADEKSHYALDTWDLQYEFPFGWSELQGMANRTDFDLKQHEKFSKVGMEILDKNQKKILPHVVCEPSQGVERAFLVFVFDAYNFDEKRQNIVLKLSPKLAPVKAAVFPLIKNPEYEKLAEDILRDLRKEWNIAYDTSGSIGKRYSRNDEAGTPMCITIDDETPKDKSVTIRDRDTTKQVRVKISELHEVVRKVVLENANLLKFGKIVETRVLADKL